MNTRDLDNRVIRAFDELTSKASRSHLLGEIAFQPRGRHEKTISDLFSSALSEQMPGNVRVYREESKYYAGENTYRHDIIVKGDSEITMVVEVKTPFTNRDGVRNKTRKSEHLPKDLHALKSALESEPLSAYALVTPIGCFPVDIDGKTIVLEPSIVRNEKEVKASYNIQWPTRPDYEANPKVGKQEVDRAMKELADERGLKVKRIKGWQRVELPKPKPNILAFLDCALYKVQLK